MNREIRVVLLTAGDRRHRFVAARLAARVNLTGVVTSAKGSPGGGAIPLRPEDDAVIAEHLAERDRVEEELLGSSVVFPDTERLAVPGGAISTIETGEWVERRRPDLILLYGSPIIKDPLLSSYSGRMVNLHLGLSPYYRGSATNFWPLVEGRPECVGSTIHLAVPEVDAGPVLAQVRPEAHAGDRAHHLGTKSLIAAVDMWSDVLRGYVEGQLVPVGQELPGSRIFRQRDFNAEAVRTLWRNLAAGMIPNYISQVRERSARFPIREWTPLGSPVGSSRS